MSEHTSTQPISLIAVGTLDFLWVSTIFMGVKVLLLNLQLLDIVHTVEKETVSCYGSSDYTAYLCKLAKIQVHNVSDRSW